MTDSIYKKACVIGDPIKHSRSPLIHNYWLQKYGISGEYSKEHILPSNLKQWFLQFAEQGYAGFNVTLPHKEIAYQLVECADDTAKAVGAVNTVWIENGIIHGGNTDVYGYLANLDAVLPHWEKQTSHAVIMGAGGAARGIVYGFIKRGIKKITVVNRTLEKADSLAKAFSSPLSQSTKVNASPWDDLNVILASADLLVNTTSLGMTGSAPLEIDLKCLHSAAIVSDIVYSPLETDLLRQARLCNLQTVSGLGMLLHQAVPGFEKWFGVRPEVDADLYTMIVADLNR